MTGKWTSGYKLRHLERMSDKVKSQWNRLQEEWKSQNLNAEQIRETFGRKTGEFRSRLKQHPGSESDLLPEAYAVVCAAIEHLYQTDITDEKTGEKRMVGIRLNDRQIQGAIALHEGNIVEMKTGEGKTFTGALPLYLNALSGKGCILVTTNSYLARRDAEDLRPLYEMLGLKEAAGIPEEGEHFTEQQKKEIYAADIVYSTQSVLACDYLLDNLRMSTAGSYLREMNYCIVDEADAVLLDNASIPHVISGKPRVTSQLASTADYLVSQMKEAGSGGDQKKSGIRGEERKSVAVKDGENKNRKDAVPDEEGDYEVDGEAVWLTEKGIRRVEEFFGMEDLYAGGQETEEIVRAVNLALRAHAVLKRDDRYVVKDQRIVLLDVREGRLLDNNMLQLGQHQALEAKEHLPLSEQKRSMAAITFQSYFNMYPRLAGMTGTGVSDAEEFRSIYGLDVVAIPTYRTPQRVDEPIRIYPDHNAQIKAAMEDILATHRSGQPVLIIVSSIRLSEEMDTLLQKQDIPHSVLNAKNLAGEAEIIKEAAQKGAVTVATAVAGRGTDIKLGRISGNKPEKKDLDDLIQHLGTMKGIAEDLRQRHPSLMRNQEILSEKIEDLRINAQLIGADTENLVETDVRELGGLAVIGIGMMRNRRSELQARGRSGRRGDIGRSVFYVSLEDDVVAENRPEWLDRYMAGEEMLESGAIRRAVMGTRKAAESRERDLRRQMRSLDDSVSQQRTQIYELRSKVLDGKYPEDSTEQEEFCRQLAGRVIEQYLNEFDRSLWKEEAGKDWRRDLENRLMQFAMENFSTDVALIADGKCIQDRKQAEQYLQDQAEKAIENKFRLLKETLETTVYGVNSDSRRNMGAGDPEQFMKKEKEVQRLRASYLRTMTLKAIDNAWVEQVDYLQQLRQIVSGRRIAGRNMQREFNREAHKAYDRMAVEIERSTLRNILLGEIRTAGKGKIAFDIP